MKIKIGTRKSKLALIQTNIAIEQITKYYPDAECVVVPIITTGDKITDKNLYDIGGKALFLKELEEELIAGNIDIAVHSLKDIPGILPDNLSIAAVIAREDPRDCFVSLKYKSINEMPKGAKIGTSSMRRKIILQKERPDLKIVQFRGNINTRLKKVKNSEVDATILACSGLIRSGLFDASYCFPLAVDAMLPAAGQGIIAIEVLSADEKIQNICNQINHQDSWYVAQAERSFLSCLDASCDTPLSAYAVLKGDKIEARYMLSDIEGKNIRYCKEVNAVSSASVMGIRAAKKLSGM